MFLCNIKFILRHLRLWTGLPGSSYRGWSPRPDQICGTTCKSSITKESKSRHTFFRGWCQNYQLSYNHWSQPVSVYNTFWGVVSTECRDHGCSGTQEIWPRAKKRGSNEKKKLRFVSKIFGSKLTGPNTTCLQARPCSVGKIPCLANWKPCLLEACFFGLERSPLRQKGGGKNLILGPLNL